MKTSDQTTKAIHFKINSNASIDQLIDRTRMFNLSINKILLKYKKSK